jgi:DNA-binding transcriptional LysR family regulator
VEEGLHVAVRVGRLPDSSLVARKLDDIQMVVCAAPSYLAQRGTPRKLDDLRKHDCLVFSDAPGPVEWRFQSGATRTRIGVTGRLWMNSLDALVSAAIEGAGIVRAPAWQVAAHIERGRLQPVLDKFAPPATPVHVVFERAKLSSPKIRTFVDYLVDQWGRA